MYRPSFPDAPTIQTFIGRRDLITPSFPRGTVRGDGYLVARDGGTHAPRASCPSRLPVVRHGRGSSGCVSRPPPLSATTSAMKERYRLKVVASDAFGGT